MTRSLLIAALLIAPAVAAQNTPSVTYNSISTPTVNYNSIQTPEIHLGSATEPSTITAPPAVDIPAPPPESSPESQADATLVPRTDLLASRHFDFVVSPLDRGDIIPGSMEDTSISLGEYCRKLRAQKQAANTQTIPNSIAQPTPPK